LSCGLQGRSGKASAKSLWLASQAEDCVVSPRLILTQRFEHGRRALGGEGSTPCHAVVDTATEPAGKRVKESCDVERRRQTRMMLVCQAVPAGRDALHGTRTDTEPYELRNGVLPGVDEEHD
jgi:hypothetical protein